MATSTVDKVDVEALGTPATMGHQISLKEAGAVLLAVIKAPYGDRALKQATWLGSALTAFPEDPDQLR